MQALSFTVKGIGATFTRPHFNAYRQTYSHIHKIALLGMFGAMLGYKGHFAYANEMQLLERTQRGKRKENRGGLILSNAFPEFYEKLSGLLISIVPHQPKFPKQQENMLDATSFWNDNTNIMFHEEFLIEPSWDIYILQGKVENEVFQQLQDALFHKIFHFDPYLGRNHFPASFEHVKVVEVEETNWYTSLHSLFPADAFEITESMNIESESYFYTEYMPVKYRPYFHYYIEKELCWTNDEVELTDEGSMHLVCQCEEKFLYFL